MKKTYRARGLTLELDSDQIFPEDPGQGTPAMVYSGIHSGTFYAAMETGELDGGDFLLSQGQQQWLVDQEDNVNEFIDMYSPKQESVSGVTKLYGIFRIFDRDGENKVKVALQVPSDLIQKAPKEVFAIVVNMAWFGKEDALEHIQTMQQENPEDWDIQFSDADITIEGRNAQNFAAYATEEEWNGGVAATKERAQEMFEMSEGDSAEFEEALQIKPRSFAEEVKVDEAKPEQRRSDKPLKVHQDTADKFLETREAIDQLNQQIAAVKAIIGEKEAVAGTMAAELMQYAEEYKDRMIRTKNVLIQLEDIPPHKAQVPAYKKVIDHLLEKLEAVSKEMRKEAEDFIESAKREIPGSTELKYSKIESVMGEGWKAWYKIVNFFKSIGARIREEIYGIEHETQDLLNQIQEA